MFNRLQNIMANIPIEDEDATLEEIAQRIVREGMGAAAIVFFESAKPISFITGQAAIFATPLLGGFIEPMRLERYATLFSDRDFLERLIRRIEELEAERAGAKTRKEESSNQNET